MVAAIAAVVLLNAFQASTGRPELTSVDARQAAVVLTFSHPVREHGAHVTITGADGTDVAAGAARITGRTVVRPVRPAPTGAYLVAYHVTTAEGDELTGSHQLGADVAGPAAGDPEHAHDMSGLSTVLPLAVVSVVLVVAVAGYVRARLRYRRSQALVTRTDTWP